MTGRTVRADMSEIQAVGIKSDRLLDRNCHTRHAQRYAASLLAASHRPEEAHRGDRGAVRAHLAAGARDGRAEDGHGGAGRHQHYLGSFTESGRKIMHLHKCNVTMYAIE